jgi:hypothetical protein
VSVPAPSEGDPRAELLVKTLLDCLCTTLAEAGRGVCCCGWRRRDRTLMPAACDCTCGGGEGVGWVRIAERRYDRQQTTNRGFSGAACSVSFVEEWTLEVGVSRCWPEGEEGLDCGAETEAAADGAWDEDLIMQALLCCKPMERYTVAPVRARTLGPQGGCIAAVAEVIVSPGPRPRGDYGYGS